MLRKNFARKKDEDSDNFLEESLNERLDDDEEETSSNSVRKILRGLCAASAVGMICFIAYDFVHDDRVDLAEKNNKPKTQTESKTVGIRTDEKPVTVAATAQNPFVTREMMQEAAKAAHPERFAQKTTVVPSIPAANPIASAPAAQPKPALSAPVTRIVPAIPANRDVAGYVPPIMPKPSAPSYEEAGTVSDGNNSIVIMSDGSLKENGTVDAKSRIAFIGGDGVKFDDGSSMSCKESE